MTVKHTRQVQQNNCGVYAIAFAQQLCSQTNFKRGHSFDECQMRKHLNKCLTETKSITAFPEFNYSVSRKLKEETFFIKVCTVCNLALSKGNICMANQCCAEAHIKCSPEEWYCINCKK